MANIRPINREPSKKAAEQEIEERPDSLTRDEGRIVTLKRRNHLQEFYDHMKTLNKERKEMDIKIEGEKVKRKQLKQTEPTTQPPTTAESELEPNGLI